MAKIHGGRSVYLLFFKKYYSIQVFLTTAPIYMVIILTLSKFGNYFFHLSGIISLIVVLGPFITLLYILYRYFKKKEGNFESGLKAEGIIFFVLKRLTDDYIIFQDVIINRRGNIDFVVLAPTGIFALEVKANSGRISYLNGEVYIDGKKHKKNILGQTKSGAAQVFNTLIGVSKIERVHPVLVFASDKVSVDSSSLQQGDVYLLNKDSLINYITSKPRVYSHEQLINFEKALLKFVENRKENFLFRFLAK